MVHVCVCVCVCVEREVACSVGEENLREVRCDEDVAAHAQDVGPQDGDALPPGGPSFEGVVPPDEEQQHIQNKKLQHHQHNTASGGTLHFSPAE